MVWGLEVFANYNMFHIGFWAVANFVIFFYVFLYFGVRGLVDKPGEKVLELLIPVLLVAFVLSMFEVPSLYVAIIVVFVFIIAQGYYLKLDLGKTIFEGIMLWCYLFLFAFLDDTSRWILFAIFLIVAAIRSERRIRNKKKGGEKKEEKVDASKDKKK